jgi:hypothetical protein
MGCNIDRKIFNEGDLIKGLYDVSRGRGEPDQTQCQCEQSSSHACTHVGWWWNEASFKTVQLDSMTFKEQVELMYTRTNILIGAHGAGLTHAIFLPPEVM